MERDDYDHRELTILALSAAGWSKPKIADHLCKSVETIKKNVDSIFEKMGVRSMAAATARAVKWDLIELDLAEIPDRGI